MNTLQLSKTSPIANRIPLATLVEHVQLRSDQIRSPLVDFTIASVSDWFLLVSWDQYYKNQEPFLTDGGLTEVACSTIVNTIADPALRRLVQIDVINLFGSVGQTLQMAQSGNKELPQLDSTGPFSELTLEPTGCEPFYFPNGARGISSKYLEAVSEELFNQGQLGGKSARQHQHILKKIREMVTELSHGQNFDRENLYAYFVAEESNYRSSRGREENHIWMSPDLCLLVAASEHLAIRARIINDLNRLNTVVQMLTGTVLPNPSVQAYLPGSIENYYREKGLIEIESGRILGYYPMAQVKQMFCDQNNVDGTAFDAKYPWKYIYKELYNLTEVHQERTFETNSHTGKGVTKLFALSVLKEYFKDVDFSLLEVVD